MKITWIIIITFIWLSIGFLCSCALYAGAQRQFPIIADRYRVADAIISVCYAFLGPIAIASVVATGWWRYGLLIPGAKP